MLIRQKERKKKIKEEENVSIYCALRSMTQLAEGVNNPIKENGR